MIGSDDIPESLKRDRLWRSGSPEQWRATWDKGDHFLEAWLNVVNSKISPKISVSSFRSNLSEISIIKSNSGWQIAWDERFFDHVICQMELLYLNSADEVRPHFYKTLLNYVGEGYALSDPHYAILVRHEALRFPEGNPTVKTSVFFQQLLQHHFTLMRMFILAHEIGHARMKNVETRAAEREILSNVIEIFRHVQKDENRQAEFRAAARGGDPDSIMEDHGDALRAAEQALETDNKDAEEILADFFAVRHTVDFARLGLIQRQVPEEDPETDYILCLVYQSLRLLFLITATMNIVREIFKPRSIRRGIPVENINSVRALKVREKMRSQIWRSYSIQIRGSIKPFSDRAHSRTNVACERYLRDHLPVFQQFQIAMRTRPPLRSADDLRGGLRRAGELFGWDTQ